MRAIFGGDYMGPVEDILAPIDGQERHALEIGTRTGTWIQAMATQFPHVQFRTLDVVPMIPHVPRQNVIFEAYDFTQRLQLEDESQDVVFLNLVSEMVKDYRTVLREAYRVLRPGGLIHIKDYNGHFWDPEDALKLARLQPASQTYRFRKIVGQKAASLGIDPDTCEKVPQWLEPDSDLWDNGQKGFKEIMSIMRTCPLYPHESLSCASHVDARISPYVRRLTEISMWDTCGLLKDSGLEDKEAENLVNETLGELRQHNNCVLFKAYCIYAIKL
ncbi:methyltransferase domain protein [Ceratobasidium sp. AG-Ba]|nr:methyltransferase domain protein [Ceratobasidium sp. AG-Ba]